MWPSIPAGAIISGSSKLAVEKARKALRGETGGTSDENMESRSMKRIIAATSAVAAATLVSAATLMGASGTLASETPASEPLRLNMAQMDAVTAGTAKTFLQSTNTIAKDGKVTTVKKTVTIVDGKKTVKKHVTVKPIGAKPSKPKPMHPDISDLRKDINEFRNAVKDRIAALRKGLVKPGKHF